MGGLRFRTVAFHAEGTSALLAVLAVLSGLTFVLPNFTTSAPTYGPLQLAVISAASLLLYAGLLFTQTRTHPGFFEDVEGEPAAHAVPTGAAAWLSFVGLLLGLGAVIGLAQTLAPAIAQGVSWLGAPRAAVGIVLALLVLAPETWAALSAARARRLQTSLNLALGAGAASVALTLPAVGGVVLATGRPLVLGLDAKNVTFLALTFVTATLTLGRGRATALHGLVHLALMGAYLALSFLP